MFQDGQDKAKYYIHIQTFINESSFIYNKILSILFILLSTWT